MIVYAGSFVCEREKTKEINTSRNKSFSAFECMCETFGIVCARLAKHLALAPLCFLVGSLINEINKRQAGRAEKK